jgi:hypothetical protein
LNVRAMVLLDDEPRFRPYPFALPNTPALASSIRNAERLLSRSPGRFDGPIAFCHGVVLSVLLSAAMPYLGCMA